MANPTNPTTITFFTVSFDDKTLHAQPSGGHDETGIIYDPLNVVNPIIEVRTTNIKQYNMIYIPTNGRHYWIREYEYIGEANVCRLHCESAVLVNWYSDICNSVAILELSTDYFDSYYVKNDYPILDQRKGNNINTFKQIPYKDCYILTTLGGGSNA